MKKLIVAAMLVGSMFANAEEAAKPAENAPAAVEAAKPTPAQVAEARAKRAQAMAKKFAALKPKMLKAVKTYGLDDEKAEALLKDLQDIIAKSGDAAKGKKAKAKKAKGKKKAAKAE